MARALFACVLLVASLSAAAPPAAGAPDDPDLDTRRPTRPPDTLAGWATTITDFLERTGEYAPRAVFGHHQGTDLRVRVARACYLYRERATPEQLAAAVAPLLKQLPTQDEARRGRLIQLLSWLQAKEAVPMLTRLAQSDGPGSVAALQALGLFGVRSVELAYMMVFTSVVFPPAPDERATQALLEALALRPGEPPGSQRRRSAINALRTHGGPEVDAAMTAALDDPELRFDALVYFWQSGVGAPVDKLIAATREGESNSRRIAVLALGVSGKKEAIAPLIEALGSPDSPRFAAEEGLHNLAGTEAPTRLGQTGLSVAKHRAKWWRVFGKDGSKFDPAKARRAEAPTPGVSPAVE